MSPPSYDFWLLDLDGTLIDIDAAYPKELFERIGDRLGRSFTDAEIELLWYGLGDARNERLREWNIDVARFWEIFHEEEDPIARAEATYLYDDAAVITAIDRPIGLVTHCQQYLTEPVLAHLDIGDWFDVIVCCNDETGWKPDPAPVHMAMNGLGVGDNGHVGVLVGDGPHDIGAAWNAGLDGIHIERYDAEQRGQCVLGDYRIRSFADLSV